MIDASPALREYEESMRLCHAESLATAIAADPDLSGTPTACRAIARFVIDAYSPAREAADPQAAVGGHAQVVLAARKPLIYEADGLTQYPPRGSRYQMREPVSFVDSSGQVRATLVKFSPEVGGL
jgi:hypothetical protein